MKAILATMLVLASLLTGCYNSSSDDKGYTGNKTSITTKEGAAQAIALVKSMHVDLLSAGITQSMDPQQTMQTSDAISYPISYNKHRDCNVSGTADTVGEKISDTEYNATNSFNSCQQLPGIVVNGENHVYAQLLGNELQATLTDNEIGVTIGHLSMSINSDIKFYSDRDFNTSSVILDGNVSLTEDSNNYESVFHDFNVTLDIQARNMQMNGQVDIFACGKEYFDIQTLQPITTAANGTFTSGKLKINGAVFEYGADKSVFVTLADGTQYVLPQGMDAICTLDSGSMLIGSTRDAVSHDFLADVNITATTGSTPPLALYQVASDTNGNFEFKDLVEGNYNLTFEKVGYIPVIAQFSVGENVQENFGLIDLVPASVQDQNFTFSGVVKHAQDATVVEGVTVVVHEGHNMPTGAVIATTTTDANGAFSTNIPAGNYTIEIYKNGFITSTSTFIALADDIYQELTIAPLLTAASQASIVLTWEDRPRDLDSHLIKKDAYEISYYHKTESLRSGETASLDADDTNGYGPETISLDNLDDTALYTYKVYNYSNEEPLSTSNAVVSVTFGSDTYTFRPPNQSGRTWTVFTIENGVLTPCTGTCIQ